MRGAAVKRWFQPFLNATTLKILAVVLMFMDHIHEMFAAQGAPFWLTIFGRLVFPVLLYNGEKGRGMKNFFYIFYPAHIALLYILSTLLFG